MKPRVMLLLGSVVLVQAAGCASIQQYERGLPKRLETEKQVTAPTVRLEASRRSDGSLELWVGAKQQVEMKRTMVYQTSEIRYEWNPWGELLEIPIGIPWMVAALLVMPVAGSPPADANHRTEGFWSSWILGPINPAQSLFFPDVVRYPHSDVELFIDEPVVTKYAMSVPSKGVELRYVFVDSAGGQGEQQVGRTDDFGRVIISAVPESARWLLAEAKGKTLRYRIR